MLILLLFFFLIQGSFYILLFSKFVFYIDTKGLNHSRPITVVICYHNEEEKIDQNLPFLLAQDVNEFILIDDCSEDSTYEKLKRYESNQIKVLRMTRKSSGKKAALYYGLTQAQNDFVLLTDADCKPKSDNWAKIMSGHDKRFVLGYGPMMRTKGMVGLFSRYETYLTALQYFSFALHHMPYMGVGRNMGVEKAEVLDKRDEIQGQNLASGDDDLMINALANGQNTGICIHHDAFMYSQPKTSWKAFLKQKARHIGTSVFYKPIHQVLLALFGGSQMAFYAVILIGLVSTTLSLQSILFFLGTKWAIQFVVNYPAMKKLKEDDLIWKFPFLDILHFIYLILLPVYYMFTKNKNSWS